ncbi:hypothetical protein GQ602_000726 [Ophiocordyceps camponoti-floridani]|uniref:Uncharacterized protein n=1 Tax=Ophiocordyceps camponoti-floridani TaxID=2030778 RepID=A0A8H4QCQ5_9HYPO|nr:hypothetical protein GQ602_000726 [Ophiocordyceps camponoti-floridani]
MPLPFTGKGGGGDDDGPALNWNRGTVVGGPDSSMPRRSGESQRQRLAPRRRDGPARREDGQGGIAMNRHSHLKIHTYVQSQHHPQPQIMKHRCIVNISHPPTVAVPHHVQ